MGNLTDARLIWLKGGLFAVLGVIASAIVFTKLPEISDGIVFAIAVWAFCRAYYFAFYVIQHYVDPNYRFAGLFDFARYAILGHQPDTPDRGHG